MKLLILTQKVEPREIILNFLDYVLYLCFKKQEGW